MRAVIWAPLVGALTVGLCGCATDAQRRAQSIRSAGITIISQASKCLRAINSDPKYEPLWIHIPKGTASPTMEQLADSAYASPSEVVLEDAHHDAMLPCRNTAVAELENVDGRAANLMSEAYNDSDSIVLALVQKKITWGEANQQTQRLKARVEQQIRTLGNTIDSELAQENAAELAHRAQVAEALSQALSAAAQAVQASRPVVTTCNGGPNYAACVTHQ